MKQNETRNLRRRTGLPGHLNLKLITFLVIVYNKKLEEIIKICCPTAMYGAK